MFDVEQQLKLSSNNNASSSFIVQMRFIASDATSATNVSIAFGDSADAFVVNEPVILTSL